MPHNKIIEIPPVSPPPGRITADAAQDWFDLGVPLPAPVVPEKPAATLPVRRSTVYCYEDGRPFCVVITGPRQDDLHATTP